MARALPPYFNVCSSKRRSARTQQLDANPPPFIPYVALDIENNDGHDGHTHVPHGSDCWPTRVAVFRPIGIQRRRKLQILLNQQIKTRTGQHLVAVVVSHPIRRLQFVRSSNGSEYIHLHIHRPAIISAQCPLDLKDRPALRRQPQFPPNPAAARRRTSSARCSSASTRRSQVH